MPRVSHGQGHTFSSPLFPTYLSSFIETIQPLSEDPSSIRTKKCLPIPQSKNCSSATSNPSSFYFFPRQQLKASHRQYSAKSSPFPFLSEISASGLTAPHIVIRTVDPITHGPETPANVSLCSHLCRPTLHPGAVPGARANWFVMNTVVASLL